MHSKNAMNARMLSLIAAIAVAGLAGCASSGLQGMAVPSQPSDEQAPASNASPDQSDAADSSDDTAPVSEAPKAASTPRQRTASSAPNKPTNAASPTASTQTASRYVCRHPAQSGRRECDAIVVAHVSPSCDRTAPYCASDLQAAYGLVRAARTNGKGVTVAIVDAYGYPGLSSDVGVYRKRMGLPQCSAANHCLRVVNQLGRATPLPKPNGDSADDWRPQQALDLDMVSALCPNCRIVLVQANSNKDADLGAGVNAAAALGAVAIVNSYGGNEANGADSAYRRGRRAIAASAGNDGLGAKLPCMYAEVICVGGTTLRAAGGSWTEEAWHKTPGSAIAAVADPKTGVAFYESAGGGWQQAGGNGVSTPIVAALFALGPSSARTNAPAWISHHDAGRMTRAAAKLGLVR